MVVHAKAINGLRDISNIDIPWENPEVVWEAPSGPYTIAKCDTQWDYWLEGYFLAHCLGTKNHREFAKAHVCYSLRDSLGVPHATILCLREGEFSPYGHAWDIGSVMPFAPESEQLRVLQVRGRYDQIAMPVYHAIVRDWYAQNGGVQMADIRKLVKLLRKHGDSDGMYHFRYKMREDNPFLWTHWNDVERIRGYLMGTSR